MPPKLTIRVELDEEGQIFTRQKTYYLPPGLLNLKLVQAVFSNTEEMIDMIFIKGFDLKGSDFRNL